MFRCSYFFIDIFLPFCYDNSMEIIYEIPSQKSYALRMFCSNAEPRKSYVRIHHHIMIELSLILSGRGIYKINDKQYSIQAGDVFLFRPNEAHCITDIENEGMQILNIHIAPAYLYTNFPNALSSEYIKVLSLNFSMESNKLNELFSAREMEQIQNTILQTKKEFEKKHSDYMSLAINYISTIFIKLGRTAPLLQQKKSELQNYQRMLEAITYIDANFTEPLTLEEIASKIGYNRCYFSHLFSKCMGMSVWDYICIKRIEEALSLIRSTDRTILQIATECGFNNTINFNKIFKKYTNLSPRSFRT